MANGLNTSWPWNTMMLIGLVILCVLYIIGIRQTHKGKDQNTHLKKRHIGAFIIAVVLMSLVFLTPLNTIARKQLFSAHMLPAVTLTTLCAPVGGAFLLLPGLVDLVVMSPLFFLWLAQIEQKTWIADQHRQELLNAQKRSKKQKIRSKKHQIHSIHVHSKRNAFCKRRSYCLRGISVTPNVARCGVQY